MLGSQFVAAEALTFQYVYDNTGQIIKSVDSSGVIIEYIYDDTGNRVETRRYTVNGLALFGISPLSGPVGQVVMLQGHNFSDVLAVNSVSFNGTAATVLSGNRNTLKVSVPEGASTGPVSIVVGPNAVESVDDFIVIPAPAITGLDPGALKSNKTQAQIVENFVVTGRHLTDSTFRFEPLFDPLAITVTSVVIDALGAQATLRLSVKAGASGSYTLIALNAIGESEVMGDIFNTVQVFDELADTDGDLVIDYDEFFSCTDANNPDTDGDSFTDQDEIEFGSDPCNFASTPWTLPDAILPNKVFKQATGSWVSVMNLTMPPIVAPHRVATGSMFSTMNTSIPVIDQGLFVSVGEATGPMLSVMNMNMPVIDQGLFTSIGEATGPMFSVANSSLPSISGGEIVSVGAASGPMLSVMNSTLPSVAGGEVSSTGETTGPMFSILNNSAPPMDQSTTGGLGEATGPAIFIETSN